ncbi:DUF5691 domain-containing protein, partial [Streptomyces sp. NPDC005133]
MPSTTTAWEELVTSALLGTDRRPLASGAGPGPIALLDAAALHTVRRRAGLRPAAAAARPGTAPLECGAEQRSCVEVDEGGDDG